MTHIEQAIRDAVEKGYEYRVAYDYHAFLDPTFWQALGKARSWNENVDDEGQGNFEPSSWHWKHGQPEWKYRMLKLTYALAEGKDAESFFKDL